MGFMGGGGEGKFQNLRDGRVIKARNFCACLRVYAGMICKNSHLSCIIGFFQQDIFTRLIYLSIRLTLLL